MWIAAGITMAVGMIAMTALVSFLLGLAYADS